MGLHYCHIMLDFCEMNSVFEGIFRVLFFGKYYFFGFSVGGKVLVLPGRSEIPRPEKYPTPLIPVCRSVKSTPGGSLSPQTLFAFKPSGLLYILKTKF